LSPSAADACDIHAAGKAFSNSALPRANAGWDDPYAKNALAAFSQGMRGIARLAAGDVRQGLIRCRKKLIASCALRP
jgi:hypothetical protein